ncbi:MAG: VCBS repeat-containing protein [Planctomycetota bacterium]
MRVPAAAIALALSGAVTATARAQAKPEVAAIQLPKTLEIQGVLAVDIDVDGRSDLVIACFDSNTGRRELRVHLGAATGPAFGAEPSRPPYAVERDVIAFAYADVDERPGRELVLFTAERAVAVLPGDANGPTYAPLFEHRLVWQAPDREQVLALEAAVQDVDGDSRDDFVLPEPNGARVLLQRREGDRVTWAGPTSWTQPEKQSRVPVRGAGPARTGRDELRLSFDLGDRNDDDFDRSPLVSVRSRAAPTLLLDFDGDGVLDGLAVRNQTLWWWHNAALGKLATAAATLPLPMPKDRLTLFDPAFDVQLADLDGDRRKDLLLTTSAQRNDEVEVRIDHFLRRGDDAWPAKPNGRLRLQTLARPPQLVDADGDGRPDLVAITVRTDLLRGLTGGGPTSLEAQLNIYRNDGERFLTPGMLNQQLQLPAPGGPRGGGASGTFVHVLPGGSGTAGALLLRSDERLLLRPLRLDGQSLRLDPPAWQVPIGKESRPRLLPNTTNAVLVVDEHEVLHVTWR